MRRLTRSMRGETQGTVGARPRVTPARAGAPLQNLGEARRHIGAQFGKIGAGLFKLFDLLGEHA